MNYYPIMLNLKDKSVLFIGAGNIALRKLRSILEFECRITVISEEIDPGILDLKKAYDEEKIKVLGFELIWLKADMDNMDDHIKNADLLFICTDDGKLNEQLELQAKKHRVWFLRCDSGKSSDFINPVVITNEDVKIAVSTSGNSPGFSKILKQKIEEVIGSIDPEQIILLGKARDAVKMSDMQTSRKKELLSKLHLMENDELIDIIEKEKS